MPKLIDRPYMKLALDEASELSAKLPLYPVSRSAAYDYPGVNLKGKYSEVDLFLESRLLAAKAAAKTKPVQVQAALADLIRAAEPLKEPMIKSSSVFRQATLAERFVTTPEAFEEVKSQITDRPEVQNYLKFIQAAELLTGVRKADENNAEIAAFCRDTLGCPLDSQAIQMSQSGISGPPQRLDIHFEELNPVVDFLHHTDDDVLMLLGDPDRDRVPYIDGRYNQEIDRYIDAYSNATFKRELQYFDQFDKLALSSPSETARVKASHAADPDQNPFTPQPLNREDFISINGISLREAVNTSILQHPENIPDREKIRNNLLTEALIRGDQVECYLPDYKNKTIGAKPIKMTLEGIERKELKPLVMNGWQRYWSKRGYFKELAAKMNQYQTTQANRQKMQERMERVSKEMSAQWPKEAARTKVSDAVRHNEQRSQTLETLATDFYGADFAADRSGAPEGGSFRIGRSGINLAVCKMLNDGYTIDDILDPDMTAARNEAGETLIQMARRDNPAELAALVAPALQEIMDSPNLSIDYANPMADPKNENELFKRAMVFDLFQEVTLPVNKAALQELYGEAVSSALTEKAGNYGVFYRQLEQHGSYPDPNALKDGAMGVADHDRTASSILMEQLLKEGGGRLIAGENPGDIYNLDSMSRKSGLALFSCQMLNAGQLSNALDNALAGKPVADFQPSATPGLPGEFHILEASPVARVIAPAAPAMR